MDQPDPAPPPRGLKLSKKALSRACQMDQPDPAPPLRGLKLKFNLADVARFAESPTPPHLRGD